MRDQHAGCVGAYLVEHDLFDFLLLSLPDNDTHSHKHGPHAQVASIAAADRQIERVMHAAGGTDAFLEEHAVIVVSDHSHAPVEEEIAFVDAFGAWDVAAPTRPGRVRPERAEIALCPSQRAAMVYVLLEEGREAAIGPLVEAAGDLEGVDLVLWRDGEDGVIASARGELRFAPGDDVRDLRGVGWTVRGDLEVLRAATSGGQIDMPAYPDGLARAWAALTLPDVRRRAPERGARLRVPRLGRGRAHGRREPRRRCTASTPRACSSWPASIRRRSGAARGHVEPRRRRPDGGQPLPPALACARDDRPLPVGRRTARSARGAARRPRDRSARRRADGDRGRGQQHGRLAHPGDHRRRPRAPRSHRRRPAGPDALGAAGARDRRRAHEGAGGGARASGLHAGGVPEGARGAGRSPTSSTATATAPEIAQVLVDDLSGAVLEAWTGYQVPWTMARGYPGAFGRAVNSPWVWIPLCILFVAPFIDVRNPWRMLHLDLLVFTGFSVALAFFNAAKVGISTPLVVPLLVYLLARMLHIGWSRRRPGASGRGGRSRCSCRCPGWRSPPCSCVGFRIGLNITDSNVIDVGYAGVIGADAPHARRAPLRRLPERQRARRHVRARSTTSRTSRSRR